jgi:hypothetical protein
MQQQHLSASSSRVEALRAKHKSLSHKIDEEMKRPFVSEYHLVELKREKLKIKEEIEGIRQAS